MDRARDIQKNLSLVQKYSSRHSTFQLQETTHKICIQATHRGDSIISSFYVFANVLIAFICTRDIELIFFLWNNFIASPFSL